MKIVHSDKLAYKFALLSVLLWSSVATAFKISLEYLTPIELVLYASLSSSIFLYLTLVYLKKTSLILGYIKNNLSKILLLSFLNPFLYYLILFKAYDLLPAQEAQAINYTWALMLAFLSVPILKHKLLISDIIAGLICYFGVLIIATQGDIFALNFSNFQGTFYALLSTVIWALYWLFSAKNNEEPIVFLFSVFILSLPFIFIFYISFYEFVVPDIKGIFGAIYVGLFEMGITFVFWLKAMQYTTKTSAIANLIFISPFLSLIFIYFLLDETILFSTIVGLVFIIFGLVIQNNKLLK